MALQQYLTPGTWGDAALALREPDASPVSGGTDLVPLLREGIVAPARLVDLRRIAGAGEITWHDDGSVHLGAAVTLDTLARDPRLVATLGALSAAARSVGSLPLRVAGTLGGNLCQRVRCWYFRGDHACLRRGGSHCSAEVGENQYHAIFRTGGCVVAHPSDCAVALMAMDATVHLVGPEGERAVPIAGFLVPSRVRLDQETCLQPGEVVRGVTVPAAPTIDRQVYIKQMQRASWDFALVSLAGVRRADGTVRLVLGGVANTPWRVTSSVEEDVASGGLSDDDIETLAERALYDATPLARNAYKIDLAAALLRRGIAQLLETPR